MQDEERRELARELHDELGPLLFAIRANATALSELLPRPARPIWPRPQQDILQAAETLQQANRRILEGLSPLHVCKSSALHRVFRPCCTMRARKRRTSDLPQTSPLA